MNFHPVKCTVASTNIPMLYIVRGLRRKALIIITGATGFVGKRFIKRAVKTFRSSEILCLVRNKKSPQEDEGRRLLKKLGVKTKKVNLETGSGLADLPKSPSLVIHLAANTDTATSNHKVNDLGTKNLIRAIKPLGANTHFMHVSTMVAMAGRKNCSKPFNENDPLVPTNEYGRSKARAEQFLLEGAKTQNFRLTIVRPNTVWGSGMRKDSLFDFLKKLISKDSILTKLNWPGLSSLIYVEDLVEAILFLSKKPPQAGQPKIYLLHGEHLTLSQMSEILHKAMGHKYKKLRLPKLFWKLCSTARSFIPYSERVFSPSLYNLFWRASIIVDNVTYCNPRKFKEVNPAWKPTKLKDKVKDVI